MTAPVVLRVGGKVLSGWESVDVSKSLEQLCGSFSVAQSAQPGEEPARFLPVFPGDLVSVELERAPLLRGWVDSVEPKIDAKGHTISVSGREITCDLVDCGLVLGGAVVGKAIKGRTVSTGSWKNFTLSQLARELGLPFGIPFVDTGTTAGAPFPVISAEPGDSIYQTLQKAAAQRGVLWTTTPSGALTLTQEGKARAADRLVYGVNVLSAAGKFSNKDRFSEYHVTGQASNPPGGGFFTGAKSANSTATATDSLVSRYRPLVVVAGGQTTKTLAQTRANWEAITRAAKSSTLEVSVQGWTQSTGKLWECGQVVAVEIPYLLGPGSFDFLVASVRYSHGPNGTISTLALVQTGAYKQLPGNQKAAVATKDAWAGIRKQVQQ